MDKKWITDKDFTQMSTEKSKRNYDFIAFLLAFAIAMSGSFAFEGYIQERQATNISNYINDRMDELQDAYKVSTPIEKMQIDIEIQKINSQASFYNKTKKAGLILSLLLILIYFVVVIQRRGYKIIYTINEELYDEKIVDIKKIISKKLKKFRSFKIGDYVYFWQIFSVNMISLQFNRKNIIILIPDAQFLLDKLLDIQECFVKNIGDNVTKINYTIVHMNQDFKQGTFTIVWNILIIIVIVFAVFVIIKLF